MWPNPQETADLVTFTEEILNGKLHFLCSGRCEQYPLDTGCKLNVHKTFRRRPGPPSVLKGERHPLHSMLGKIFHKSDLIKSQY